MAGINLQKYRKQGLEVLIADIYFLSQSCSPFSNLWLQAAEILHDNRGGRKGVRKPQNRTEIRQKTENRIRFFPEYRNRAFM